MGTEVPPGEERWLKVYYWNGNEWKPLSTQLDTYHNLASARTQGEGLYAIMSSIEIRLPGPGWVDFGYPIQETRPITEVLLSISGYYTTVYHYDKIASQDPWKVYDVTAPDWVNDLYVMEFGKAYTILMRESVTLYLKGASMTNLSQTVGLDTNWSEQAVPSYQPVPATYYGILQAGTGFTPTVGMTVTAMIGANQCGQTRAMEVEDEIVYSINVLPDGPKGAPGCGDFGRRVLFETESHYLAPFATWDSYHVRELPLHPMTRVFYLVPFIIP
jgi:hypothetical protein